MLLPTKYVYIIRNYFWRVAITYTYCVSSIRTHGSFVSAFPNSGLYFRVGCTGGWN